MLLNVDTSKLLFDPKDGSFLFNLSQHSEFDLDIPSDVDKDKLLTCIALICDFNSPVRQSYSSLSRIKKESALISGFTLGANKRFTKSLEDILVGQNKSVNKAIEKYEELSKDYEERRALYLDKTNPDLGITPEAIAFAIAQNKTFADFNPYGKKYSVDELHFVGDVPPENRYHEGGSDSYFGVNYDDDELRPIYISLPKPPNKDLIRGKELERVSQTFERLEIPHKLRELENRVHKEMTRWSEEKRDNIITGYKVYSKYWEILTDEQEDFKKEINFIKKFIWHSIYGYWQYIKGKPVYFPPWYFMFLNTWKMPYAKNIISDEKYPEFRFEDLKTELFKWYLFNTKETFKHIDRDGNAQKNEYGIYEVVEMPYRTFYGIVKPKRRRCGESNRALNNLACIARQGVSKSCAIMADTGVHAMDHYRKRLLPAWRYWPMFIKPAWDGNNSPAKLNFTFPGNVYNMSSMDSKLYAVERATEGAVDSDALHGILLDESAKLVRVDASQRWWVTRFTLSQGPDIIGWAELPSTIEEMNEGGEEFYDIWIQSNFYVRDKVSGQTKSGLGREFIPACRGYDKNIDHWGFSVVDDPTDEQIQYALDSDAFKLNKVGAKEYHLTRRDVLLKSGSQRDLKTFRGLRRKEPLKSSECWMATGGDVGFPIETMTKRLAGLRLDNYKDIVVGDFYWVDNIVDGIVGFRENPDGKFNVSLLLDNEYYRSNEITLTRKWSIKEQSFIDVYAPVNKSRFTVGIDPIENLPKDVVGYSQSRLSDGGIAVYWDVDRMLEPEWDSDISNSGRFVCTYRNRPGNFHELVSDVIMVSKYYGAMMYFERNKTELINRIDDRGYSGYFKYRFNLKAGQFDASPGGYAGADSIDNLFNSLRDHFSLRGHIERHHDLLAEGIEITGKEKLKRKDLLAAAGWALEGAKSTYGMVVDKRTKDEDYINIQNTFLAPKTYR